jgi:hypothetical protein
VVTVTGDSDHGFLVVNEAKRLQDILLDVQCATKIERYDWATAIHTAKRNITTQLQQRAGTCAFVCRWSCRVVSCRVVSCRVVSCRVVRLQK